MNRSTRLAAVLVAILTLASVVAPMASAAIRITKINYDSPGSDTGSNVSRNGEWIRLANTGGTKVSLTGWKIRDAAGHTYTFAAYSLGAGRTVTIHTGRGSNGASHRYWNQGGYVWNNDADKATLKRANGSLADTCAYSGSSVAKIC